MKFKVTGVNVEQLLEQEIEAKDKETAEEKFIELFKEGMITVANSEVVIKYITEVE